MVKNPIVNLIMKTGYEKLSKPLYLLMVHNINHPPPKGEAKK